MRNWPHAPSKVVSGPGRYIVTAGTYKKHPYFSSHERLDFLQNTLLEVAEQQGWKFEAWAVFANHYHFVGLSPPTENPVFALTSKVHSLTAKYVNKKDQAEGRVVWYRSWDTQLTFEKSYLARLAYVHFNPVRHGLVENAIDYPWCSAKWFAQNAEKPFYETVCTFKTDRVKVIDDF